MTYSYNAKVQEVHSGDSFTALVDLGFGQTHERIIKLMGVEAPQMKVLDEEEKVVQNPLGIASKKKLVELIKGKDVILETRKTGDDYHARVSVKGMPLPINDYMLRYGLVKMKR
jgi:endonuclease YncB( thermonuclease family)